MNNYITKLVLIFKKNASSKAYQTQKHCREVSNTEKQDFTTLESYHNGNYFIFCLTDCKTNNRNTAFTLQSNLPGMWACMYLIDHTALHCIISWTCWLCVYSAGALCIYTSTGSEAFKWMKLCCCFFFQATLTLIWTWLNRGDMHGSVVLYLSVHVKYFIWCKQTYIYIYIMYVQSSLHLKDKFDAVIIPPLFSSHEREEERGPQSLFCVKLHSEVSVVWSYNQMCVFQSYNLFSTNFPFCISLKSISSLSCRGLVRPVSCMVDFG